MKQLVCERSFRIKRAPVDKKTSARQPQNEQQKLETKTANKGKKVLEV